MGRAEGTQNLIDKLGGRAFGDWRDATILSPPKQWGGGLPSGPLPAIPGQIDSHGRPIAWPLRYTIAHWAALLTAPGAGDYVLCCRTIDAAGVAQPLPRPLAKSGRSEIQRLEVKVQASQGT